MNIISNIIYQKYLEKKYKFYNIDSVWSIFILEKGEMATQSWYGIPIVEFQTLEDFKAYRLECVVTLLLYRKGKNETQKNYFARIINENDKKKIWLTEKNVNKILKKRINHHIFIANTYEGYDYDLQIIPVESVQSESEESEEFEEQAFEFKEQKFELT